MGESLSLGPRITGDHHYALLEHVLPMCSGVAVEFGVGSGMSTRLIAAHMPVIGFDSFQGLQTNWRPEFKAGAFACPPPTIPNTRLVIGWFTDTLPSFHWPENIDLAHIDCDTYEATKTVLEHLPLKPGTVLVFDEMFGYTDGPGANWWDHEYKAFTEHAEHTGLTFEPLGHGEESWACRITDKDHRA